MFNSLDVDGTKTIVGDGNAFLPKTLYSVSEPHAKLKVREQLIQGNQKLRLIGVKKRTRIISLLFKLIEEVKRTHAVYKLHVETVKKLRFLLSANAAFIVVFQRLLAIFSNSRLTRAVHPVW